MGEDRGIERLSKAYKGKRCWPHFPNLAILWNDLGRRPKSYSLVSSPTYWVGICEGGAGNLHLTAGLASCVEPLVPLKTEGQRGGGRQTEANGAEVTKPDMVGGEQLPHSFQKHIVGISATTMSEAFTSGIYLFL